MLKLIREYNFNFFLDNLYELILDIYDRLGESKFNLHQCMHKYLQTFEKNF